MSKNTAARVTQTTKPVDPSDIHDIRSLTATGAIPLPHHRPRRTSESGSTAE